ncbi:Putative ATP-dependent RNA helicase ucp12 [Yamadazyma tenuis]|uniref:Putative ATP-dependent RNA helicase ucp12 n=1 Tax=Candida tenuis TaxID=2315449 RepID=UPI002798A060|nr:Putative ATP-dependent RNA helicase ucp12 [Yamadazyma tenuis]
MAAKKKKPEKEDKEPAKKGKAKTSEEEEAEEARLAKAKKGAKKPDQKPTSEPENKPTRGIVVGDNFGWTGKLPLTLLYEHCQRQKWPKPIINCSSSSYGYSTHITLLWENPKTKEMIRLNYNPKLTKATANESKHLTATYVLYRLNYLKNLKIMLPVVFRDYWDQLAKDRLEILEADKNKHELLYGDQPFQAYLVEQERREKQRQKNEKLKQLNQNTKKDSIALNKNDLQELSRLSRDISDVKHPHFSRKIWDNSAIFDLDSDLRVKIENLIKYFIHWNTRKNSDSHDDKLTKFLVKLGFREPHIREALSYTNTFNSTLEWLLFYLPEDDLPGFFNKSNYHSTNQVKISKDLKYENSVASLRSSGFNIDDIKLHLKLSKNHEQNTLISLCQSLIPSELYYDDAVDLGMTPVEVWENEMASLKSMDLKLDYTSHEATIHSKLTLKLCRSHNYPNDLIGIRITNELPNYVKMSALRKIIHFLYENKYVGSEYVFTLVDFVSENYDNIINDPGPLIAGDFKPRQLVSSSNVSVSKYFKNFKVNQEKVKSSYQSRTTNPKFKDLIKDRSKLPAWAKQADILSLVDANQIVLITGETGSGKSTQIVQFILDKLNSKHDYSAKIMVTQPRRISTLGLADRISAERMDTVGHEIGYIIRGESKVCDATRITFVTTGVLLRLMQTSSKFLNSLQYIVIDEVHERSVDSDFLLILLKNSLKKFPNLKIILMSATIDKQVFSRFFNIELPHLHIEGRTFPIKDYYLEYVLDEIDYEMEVNDQLIRPQADAHFFKSGNLNYDLIVKLVHHLRNTNGSILIFMSGIYEINQLRSKVLSYFDERGEKVVVLPLHSALSSKDQTKVFNTFRELKVIIATNIAETSITIPDCTVVIDTGRVKTIQYDSTTKTTKLVENWCSQAESMQRRGRSGRIQKGNCYHLYTQETYDLMIKQPIPEIKRTNLDNLFLIIKSMGIDDVKNFLTRGIDAPSELTIDNSEITLKRIGALNESSELTNLGKYLSLIPTDLSNAKLIIFGCIFGCLNSTLILAAIKTIGSPFQKSYDFRDKVKIILAKYSQGNGDFIGYLNIMKAYTSSTSKTKFINEHCLSYLAVKDIMVTTNQYENILKDLNFYKDSKGKDINRNDSNVKILKALITAAYYPNISKIFYPDTKYFASSAGAIEVNPDEKLIRYFVEHKDHQLLAIREKQRATKMKQKERQERWDKRDKGETDSSDSNDNLSSYNEDHAPKRVFIHPSSTFFDKKSQVPQEEPGEVDINTPQVTQLLQKPPFVVYGSSYETSKHFINEITPTNVISVLLFGGDINYNLNLSNGAMSPGIIIDNWITIRTWCKNAVLVKNLRELLDNIIDFKLARSSQDEDNADYAQILSVIEMMISQQ